MCVSSHSGSVIKNRKRLLFILNGQMVLLWQIWKINILRNNIKTKILIDMSMT